MKPVRVADCGIFIRKDSLRANNIPRSKLLSIMETDEPFDESEELISFGPHFGSEATNVFTERLEKLGLKFLIDFSDYLDNQPDWCQFCVQIKDQG